MSLIDVIADPEDYGMQETQNTIILPEIQIPVDPYPCNMEVLWEQSPHLAQKIDLIDESELPEAIPARNGQMTCQMQGEKGMVFLHSRYDPGREAEQWASGVEEMAAAQIDEKAGKVPMCYIVDGFGLGYHVKALYERLSGETTIIVIEPDLRMLRIALELNDYSEMLAGKRVSFITRNDREEIFARLQPYGNLMMLGMVFTRTLIRLNEPFYRDVHQLITEFVSFIRTHMVTLLGMGLQTCRHILANLKAYITTPPINILKNRFIGYPVVLVSAGPSLRKNLPLLKKYRDQVMVVAVQTTLKPLLAEGIKPDFVTSLDYHEVSRRFFEGLDEELADIHLIAEPKANPVVIDYYLEHGPVSVLFSDFANRVLGGDGANPQRDGLAAGATVAHLAFYLAQYLGGDPIIFIGQDLAFTDNVYYSPGTALHATWQPELNRFCTIEMKEWERIVRHRNLLRQVKDIHGQAIYTDEQMFTYLQQFEKDFADARARVIDATGGGALKHHCETMDFAAALEQNCHGCVDQRLFDYRRDWVQRDLSLLDAARQKLDKTIENVEELQQIVKETIVLVQDMLELIDDQPRLNERMVRLDELRTMVRHRQGLYRLVSYVSQMAELYRFRQDRAIEAENAEGKQRQRRQLLRDVGYVSEIAKGCERLLGLLNETKQQLEESPAN
ncbi:MAG: motility associated factor glycosyltransferase family protein [Sedimentisphaerales bacterium]|nr:motility associated factor glycosyltransferase family protein [Sedimentisphaerales bacterium]